MKLVQWVRRSFIAGFFVTVPLFISVAALLWLFRELAVVGGPESDVARAALRGAEATPTATMKVV